MASDAIIEVSDSNFESEVVNSDVPVLVAHAPQHGRRRAAQEVVAKVRVVQLRLIDAAVLAVGGGSLEVAGGDPHAARQGADAVAAAEKPALRRQGRGADPS